MESNASGVYYQKSDYANFALRLSTLIIDLALSAGFGFALDAVAESASLTSGQYDTIIVVFLFLYFIEMKRRYGTIGNIVTRTRLIDVSGKRPSIYSMLVRSSLFVLGSLFFIIDIIWVTSDEKRQMIRDKFSGIYVIKRKAQPLGHGKVIYSSCMIASLNFLFKDVETN
ncbi:RDD family protein [Rubellicoccus peritrichatus]|uniref:RDD family protein n=1 Tax=Rubellicoccus peritrichatus TaxID=3080537 RepID=A0AAQ3QTM9_9BACT|nr:RDD family protein [Puniceicoccus sp. CR14]WOO39558.1 RDD family protein [Puniceicoccus sp. CR14]